MAFGKEIKRLRTVHNISAQVLADAIGIDSERLRSWEKRDFNPREEDTAKIEKYFGMPLSELVKLDRLPKVPSKKEEVEEKKILTQKDLPIRGNKIFEKYEPIPVLDIDIAASEAALELYDDKNSVQPLEYLYVPEFSGCTAVFAYSDSMEPLIRKGARMFIKQIEDWQSVLEYGQIYVIGLHDGRRFLKYVKKSEIDPQKNFLLVSHNDGYEPFEVPKEKIRSIWIVDGWMNKHTQSTFHLLEEVVNRRDANKLRPIKNF